MRLIAAIIISALVCAPLFWLGSAVTGDLDNQLLIPVLKIVPIVALIVVMVVGLPVHFFLQYKKLTRPWHYAFPGFLVPFVFVMATHPFGEDGALFIFLQGLQMGAFGAVVALVFRYTAIGRKAT